MAANYLQTLDKKNDVKIFQTIEIFYKKARAYKQLSNFYQTFAQLQIDEYRDYVKALKALEKAEEALTKISEQKDDTIELINRKMDYVGKYIESEKQLSVDHGQGLQMCLELLKISDLEIIVREGDVYSLIIETYSSEKMYRESLYYLQEMQTKGINIREYIDESSISEIYHALGIDESKDDDNDDEVPDDIN